MHAYVHGLCSLVHRWVGAQNKNCGKEWAITSHHVGVAILHKVEDYPIQMYVYNILLSVYNKLHVHMYMYLT